MLAEQYSQSLSMSEPVSELSSLSDVDEDDPENE